MKNLEKNRMKKISFVTLTPDIYKILLLLDYFYVDYSADNINWIWNSMEISSAMWVQCIIFLSHQFRYTG